MNPLFSVPRSPVHNLAQPKHTTAGVNVTGAGRELFRKAAMRVAGRVYVGAMESGHRDAAMHAWKRLCALVLSRPHEEVVAMEKRMGVHS